MTVSGQHHAPAALHPGKRIDAHFTEDWVGSMAGLDGCGKSRLHRGSIHRVASRYTSDAIPSPDFCMCTK
jgi:hypothetical protein